MPLSDSDASDAKNPLILSTFEQVIFPEFDSSAIAKIDTGAYSGALHCSKIAEQEEAGFKSLLFVPLDSRKVHKCDEFMVRYIRSPNGVRGKRYFIETRIILNGLEYPITLSLTDRSPMKWPVLIGRRFLKQHNFMVDPSRPNRYDSQRRKKIQ